jgi:putative phage-type endonuclease
MVSSKPEVKLLSKKRKIEEHNELICRKRPFVPMPPVLPLYSAAMSISPAWFHLRKYRITASKLAEVCGMIKYSSGWAFMWQKIVDPEYTLEDNPILKHGRDCEPICVQRFCEATGNSVLESPPCFIHERYPFLLATPDAYVEHDVLRDGKPALIECKAPNYGMYDEPPINYVIQMFLQMSTYQIDTNYLAAWYHGDDHLCIWRLKWNEHMFAWIMMRVNIFMQHVVNRVPITKEYIKPCPYETKEWMKELCDKSSPIFKGLPHQQWQAEIRVKKNICKEYKDAASWWHLPPRMDIELIHSQKNCSFTPSLHASETNDPEAL